MKNDAHNTRPEHRKHSRLRAVLSSCLAFAFALALVGFFALQDSSSPLDSPAPEAFDYSEASQGGSQADGAAAPDDAALDSELGYVHDQVLVALDPDTSLSKINESLASLDGVLTKDVSDQDPTSSYVLIELDDGATVADTVAALENAGLQAQPNFLYTLAEEDDDLAPGDSDLPALSDDEQSRVRAFLASDSISEQSAAGANDDEIGNQWDETGKQWALASVDAQRAWGIEKCGEKEDPVSIAILDTGIIDHADLSANIRATYNAVDKKTGFDAVKDDHGHGTHVAGIASAVTNNSIGVAGVSYNAGLVGIRVSDASGGMKTATLANAYDWLFKASSEDASKSNAELYNVRVVNMSLGGYDTKKETQNPDALLTQAITKAYTGEYGSDPSVDHASILTVVAAGNTLPDDPETKDVDESALPYLGVPADAPHVLSVINLNKVEAGDTDKEKPGLFYWVENNEGKHYCVKRAAGSNYNLDDDRHAKNISAPGTDIYSTVNTGGYGYSGGTSMASPLVAGIAALLFSERPDISAQQAMDIIHASATDLDAGGWDRETGYGEINAYHALQLMSAGLISADGKSIHEFDTSIPVTVAYGDGTGWETYGSPANWIWSVSDEKAASLSIDDAAKTVTLTPKKTGNITVTAQLKDVEGDALSGFSISKEFMVEQADISQATLSVSGSSFTYTGLPITPQVSVSLNGVGLVPNADYTASYGNNVEAGTATVTVKGMNGYAGEAQASFEIVPASVINATLAFEQQAYPYTGSAITPTPAVALSGFSRLEPGTDYEYEYRNNVDMGTGQVRVVGKRNFTGTSAWVDFSISKKSLANAIIEPIGAHAYDGSSLMPAPTVILDGVTLERGTDYKVSYGSNIGPGQGSVTVTGCGAYEGSQTAFFTIEAKKLSCSITVNGSQTYTGKALQPSVTVKVGSIVLAQGTDYKIDGYADNTDAGTATVTILGLGSYAGIATQTFIIAPRSLATATVAVEDRTYTGNAHTPEPTVTFGDFGALVKDRDYTVAYSNNTNVGMGTVTVTGKGNFTGTVSKSFAIKAAANQNSGTDFSGDPSSNSGTDPSNANASQPSAQSPQVTGKWVKTGSRWWFRYDSRSVSAQGKSYPANEWVVIDNARYHFDPAGWMHSGWQWLDGAWYYFGSDGAMKTGWARVGGTWYYMASDGRMQTGTHDIGGQTYRLASSGAMRTGWVKEGADWYYHSASGAMVKGWARVGGTWYYMASDGRMQTGTHDIGGQTYRLASSGAMRTGWVKEGTTWYYHSASGAMVKGWARVGGTWYYLGSDGAMYTGKHVIGDQTYFFASSGAMRTGWVKEGADWYYCSGSGAMQSSRWIGNYYVGADGVMATDVWIGKWHVDASGRWDMTR